MLLRLQCQMGNDNSKTVMVNGECYWAVLQKFHYDLAQKVTPNQLSMTWFMQDGALPHAAGDTITFFWQLFRNCLVALGTAHDWAPHSPDLTPLDYQLWGAAKGSLYANCPATLDDLKQVVSHYLQALPHETAGKLDRTLESGSMHLNTHLSDQCLSEGHTSRTSITRILHKCQFQTLGSH